MNSSAVGWTPGNFIVRGRGLTLTRLLGILTFMAPGAGFIAALFMVRGRPEFAFLESAGNWGRSRGVLAGNCPLELWLIAVGGSLATLAGMADFVWHVRGLREVSRREERGEIVALALGGAPLFALMAAASVAAEPKNYLLPILVVTMFTVICVCHDEFVYHRRACARMESFFHHVLLTGNGLAFLAWFAWIFVRERGVA